MYWNILKNIEGLIVSFYFSIKKKGWKFLSSFFVFILLSGCATIPIPKVEKVSINKFYSYNLADGTKIYPETVDKIIPDVDILAIDDKIKLILDVQLAGVKNPRKRLQLLMEILHQKVLYDTVGDSYGVKTAQETFDTGTGNCLSFSNLFIAMARYAGMNAGFQEIPTLPNWTREGGVLFFTRHIGASVDIREHRGQVIQLTVIANSSRYAVSNSSLRYYFTPSELDPRESNPYSFSSISDNRAFAQYYNNIGSQHLADGKSAEAFQYFVKAIKTDPELSFAWSNLGVVYRRNRQYKAAEDAYFQGLAVTRGYKDSSILTIMSNLARLYDLQGDTENATLYKNRVASFREKNPYYQYAAAKTAYHETLYDKSIKHFKDAIRLKDDEHLFYYGLALSYIKIGNIKKAEGNIHKAIRYAWSDRKKADYEQVREMIGNGIN